LSDAELLARFVDRRDDAAEAAFEMIVAKHGPMVLGICRAVLRHAVDADDAFQATFLVLVRKAGSVRAADSLAPWLFGVARRVATKARSAALRRKSRETSVGTVPEGVSVDDVEILDARPILFEELDRLPEKYRSPVILCHLEGLSHEEAAQRLRWPPGTVAGRLSRARGLLRTRLARRGLGVSSALGAGVFLPSSANAVPLALLQSTVRTATTFTAGGSLPVSILSLSQGAITAMHIHNLKFATIIGSGLAMLAVAMGYASGQIDAGPAAQEKPQDRQTTKPAAPGVTPSKMTLPMVYNDAIIAVTPKDGRSISAMVVDFGVWQEYQAPEGVKVLPILSTDVLALHFSGPEVREIAAFCTSSLTVATQKLRGTWVRQRLRQPAKGNLTPTVLPGMAYYVVGTDIYAFSATMNSWDTLHLEGTEQGKIAWGRTDILVEQGEMLYVFSASGGKWSKGLKVPIPAKK
jgi:RNA polymerase sigma factor (sigma-70 family)